MRFVISAVSLLVLSLALASSLRADESQPVEASITGRKIGDFVLRDTTGREQSLHEHQGAATVVVFLGTDCPLAQLYASRLQALSEEFRDRGVRFLAINSNTQDGLSKIAAYATRHGVTFPVLKDGDQRVADRFSATRTPEAFLLDKSFVVRYHGRIDDQYGVGIQRPKVTRADLTLAINELLSGQTISVPETPAPGCFIGRQSPVSPRGDITYHKHVAPILNARCVECHREGEIAPFPMVRYADLQGWGPTITEVVRNGRMPPWNASPEHGHFRNDARLSEAERQLLLTWIENGMPEGDPADASAPPRFVSGWRIPQPDQVIAIRETPVSIPARGTIEYQYFEVDPGFTEDKYVYAAEARPDNRAVVHHIIAYIKAPGEDDFRKRGILVGYAPGSIPMHYRDGTAKLIPAGSKLVFEMHYTANGTPQRDLSHIGLKFLDKSQVRRVVQNAFVAEGKLKIPPHASNHVVRAERTMPRDLMLLNLTPHMHVRGKSFRFEAFYPDGQHVVLLDVPRYDFNWQLSYELAEPKLLPRGTRIVGVAAFDNSEDNLANPDPTREVHWGDQSWEEMMIGFFDVVPAENDAPRRSQP